MCYSFTKIAKRIRLILMLMIVSTSPAWSADDFSASVELETGPFGLTCENVDDDIAEIVEEMDDREYGVMSGAFELYEPGVSNVNIPFAKPDSIYLITKFENDENSYRFGGRDAIVWRGCTPLSTDNYRVSIHAYNARRVLTQDQNTIPITTLELQASLNDPLLIRDGDFTAEENNDTDFEPPFDRRTNIVVYADEATATDVTNSYNDAGILEAGSLTLLPISPNAFLFSESELGTPRDEIMLVMQIDRKQSIHQDSFEIGTEQVFFRWSPPIPGLTTLVSGIDQGQSFPFRVFLREEADPITPATVTPRDTTPPASQVQQAESLKAPFDSLVSEVISHFEDQNFSLLSNTPFTSDGATVNGQSLFSGQHGIVCATQGESCQLDSNFDANWSDQAAHTLSAQDLYVVVGIDHARLGMAEFGSYLGAYTLNNQPDTLSEIANWRSIELPWLSVNDVVSSLGPSLRSVAKQSFIAHLTRDAHCPAANDESIATFNCLTTEQLGLADTFIFRGSTSLNPQTNTRPDDSQLVPWRLLRFTK